MFSFTSPKICLRCFADLSNLKYALNLYTFFFSNFVSLKLFQNRYLIWQTYICKVLAYSCHVLLTSSSLAYDIMLSICKLSVNVAHGNWFKDGKESVDYSDTFFSIQYCKSSCFPCSWNFSDTFTWGQGTNKWYFTCR